MYQLFLYGKDGRWPYDNMQDCINTACVQSLIFNRGLLQRHARLEEDHIAFYLRTPDMPPDTYLGVITYANLQGGLPIGYGEE